MTWQERIVNERHKRSVDHIKKYQAVEKINNQLKEEDSKDGKVDGDGDRNTESDDDP